MTEFCEAVAYAIYCVGLEGLHSSLKPEEASCLPLRWSSCLSKQQLEAP